MGLAKIKDILNIKKHLQVYIFSALFALFLVSSILYIYKENVIFPIINFVILFSHLILYKGKYRIYALFLYVPFIVFFNYKPLNIGSFFSYFVLLYCLIVLIENLIKKDSFTNIEFRRITICLFLFIYVAILTLIYANIKELPRLISIFGYIFSIGFFIIDFKSSKNFEKIVFLITFGFLIANLIACFIFYIVKGNIATTFLKRFVSEKYAQQYNNPNSSFRYPGLSGDPNYLGFYVLFLSAIVLVNIKKLNHKPIFVVLVLLLQIFPIVGQSKNYIICFIAFVIAFCTIISFKNKYGLLITASTLAALLMALILSQSFLAPVILRFINLDFRNGFINAMTTGRFNIQLSYFNKFLSDPSSFIIGRGFGSLYNDASAHNIYVMSIWYFGIFGSFIYVLYIISFINIKSLKINKFNLLPLIIILVCGLSLDFISYAEMFIFLLFTYYLSTKPLADTYLIDKQHFNEEYI